jgi:hypothetical protein
MISENQSINLAVNEQVFKSLVKFQERMEQVKQILSARDALATVEFIDDYTNRPEYVNTLKKQPQQQFVEKIEKHRNSLPGRAPKYHALNEAGIVLLSAYLEGFIEELHTMVMHELMGKTLKSTRVLKILDKLSKQACWDFKNPAPHKIKRLFRVCGIEDIFSDRSLKTGELRDFVDLRNKIAHGEPEEVEGTSAERWPKIVFSFAEQLSAVVRNEIIAVKSEQI